MYHKCAKEKPSCKGLGQGIKGYHKCAKLKNCKKADLSKRNINKQKKGLLKDISKVELKRTRQQPEAKAPPQEAKAPPPQEAKRRNRKKFNPGTIKRNNKKLWSALKALEAIVVNDLGKAEINFMDGSKWTKKSANNFIKEQLNDYSNPDDILNYVSKITNEARKNRKKSKSEKKEIKRAKAEIKSIDDFYKKNEVIIRMIEARYKQPQMRDKMNALRKELMKSKELINKSNVPEFYKKNIEKFKKFYTEYRQQVDNKLKSLR